MKLNNKGFVASGVIYSLLILFLTFLLGLMTMFSSRKMILDKLKKDVLGSVTELTYTVFEKGTTVYYNPVTGNVCSDYSETNSKSGVKLGCLKWYVLNDEGMKSSNLTLILDHNTSIAPWNSSNDNTEGMLEVINSLKNDTDNWVGIETLTTTIDSFNYNNYKARLATANEIADAVDNKTWAAANNNSNWFYFDSATTDTPQTLLDTCKVGNITGCKYGWLYDRTSSTCTTNGCLDNSTSAEELGYWTSTSTFGNVNSAWLVLNNGSLNKNKININDNYGVRPVITINKTKIFLEKDTKYNFEYTGNYKTFVAPVTGSYKIETWGAQGGNVTAAGYTSTGGKGAYASGTIDLTIGTSLYIYVGGKGNNGEATNSTATITGGYNGGGNNSSGDSKSTAGGGATDIRLTLGTWDNDSSLKSRIMVAAGGGGSTISNVGAPGQAIKDTYTAPLSIYGNDGTQTAGGALGTGYGYADGTTVGVFGKGGNAGKYITGAGGGGYYGGAGGAHISPSTSGGGGGGSSYVSGQVGAVAITSSTSLTPRKNASGVACANGTTDIICSYHYSNKIFKSITVLSGAQSMPSYSGSTNVTGNSGNGYARITYIGE